MTACTKMSVRKHLLVFSILIHVIALAQAEYHGKLIGSFPASSQHSVAGTVYAVDDDTIRIIGFNYDGLGPDAFLWGGASTTPSPSGFIIPDETGSTDKWGQYINVNIEVDLPAGQTVSSLRSISVWCRDFSANFGHVSLPANFVPPAPHDLGEMGFANRVHDVYASAVIILNDKQFEFRNLDYDGYGPRAYFWVGPSGTPSNNADNYAIPDENGGTGVISGYNDATITITMPDDKTVFDIGHIGLWCVAANQDFGHVNIPSEDQLNIPPSPLTSTMPIRMEFPNCETLVEEELQVSWLIDGSDITIRLRSTNPAGDYAAFGVSGSTTGTEMVGGDVVVAFIDDAGDANAVDYYLQSKAQCSPQGSVAGSCPDTIFSNTDNVELLEAYVESGVTSITYRRPLAATDATEDKAITTTGSMYVIWATGSINADGRVAYHNQNRSPASSNLQIEFGRASSTCPALNQGANVPTVTDGWEIDPIKELGNATFTAEMGLSGGRKGYDAITGRVGWGVAWFIDGQLIPEITVKRGSTYTFRVSGGNDPSISGNYHPFYITDSADGGYAQLSAGEQAEETIYAGPVEGPLCQYMNTDSTGDSSSYSTFDAYAATLIKDCESGTPGELVWTVTDDTPKEVYYQCYTHRFLGWKIHVSDAATHPTISAVAIGLGCLLYSLMV